jgi:hypothetical protein
MTLNLAREVAALQRLTVTELRARYAEAFGEPPTPTTAPGWSSASPGGYRPSPRATSPNAPAGAPRSWPATPNCV